MGALASRDGVLEKVGRHSIRSTTSAESGQREPIRVEHRLDLREAGALPAEFSPRYRRFLSRPKQIRMHP
jgi:hypothetical protein